MMTKKAQSRLASAALAATFVLGTAATAAAAASVYTDYNHNIDFHQYHTFSVYRVKSGDAIMQNRLQRDIEASLQERGWQEVPQGGDVAITAISNVRTEQEYTDFYNGFGPGWGYGGWGGRWGWGGWGGRGWGWGPGVAAVNVPVGTLAVDMYDTRTHQLVFRGTAADEFSSHADTNSRRTAKEVDKIFNKLPKVNKAG